MGAKEGGGGGNAVAKIRLHVGGLGESVTSDDLRKIFSPMGSVNEVEFVRTKGRSFAYIDFSPSSDKSLAKLFSTYNGCVWKGGRLRFEKAKEHYLARLKREWEENAALASCVSDPDVDGDQDSKIPPLEIPKNPKTKDIRQLKLFFPRLGKLKSVPFSGSGKHKYSFQRVDVPALPTHFCECEEHFKPLSSQVKRVDSLESEGEGINEEEVNIMNSVMNKLFQKEKHSESALGNDGLKNEEDEHETDLEPDEDNIIINVVSSGTGRNKSPFPRKLEQEAASRKRRTILNETQDLGESGVASGSGGQKKNCVQTSKKKKSITDDGNGRKESTTAAELENRGLQQTDSDKSKTKSVLATVQSEPVVKLSSGSASCQKASWKALVANGKDTTFSVSTVLSSIASEGELPNVPSESDGLGPVDELTEDMTTQKRKKPRHAKKARKLTLSDSGEIKVAPASEVVAEDKSKSHQTDTIEEIEHAVPELGTEESAINHSLHESTPKALVVNSGSQATDTAFGLEEQSGFDNSNSPKDKEDGNQNISVEKNVDRESANVEIADKSQPVQQDVASARSGTGSTWLRNLSWTQMISQNSTFSITQLVPGIISEKHEPVETNSLNAEKTVDSNQKSEPVQQKSSEEGSAAMETTEHSFVQKNQENIIEETTMGKDELFGPLVHEERNTTARKIARGISGIGEEEEETCLFMRNAASLKEWAKAKKALSERRKRMKNEN